MSVDRETIETIARELFEAKRDVRTVPYVSPRLPERDLDAAYAISAEFARLRETELGVRRVGRKVGLTNPLVQERVGIDEPDYGIIHDDMAHASGVHLPLSRYNRLLIEAEVAFGIKTDILDASREAVEAAIDFVTPAFEVVDFRYGGSVGQIVDTIADNAGCSGIVLGEEKHAYGEVDLTGVEMVITGGDVEITRGIGKNVLEDPVNAVIWLAETALRTGEPLRAGEILLSGSIGYIEPWPADVECVATITGLGRVVATADSKG
ncbi:2-keto-4-pentenoate hydratase [Nocardioides luteus]|uniref:2-keto-4-pentenoate hydratase n=1 Tax=Nocardioides luteus TaxID=1844 RepID=A0ABQ5T335_9ACTN|nr:fumarylacetoacetate hydrolase family protein [Nocardioides luteus]MDR7310336.1 2-keto-4-pentenoate hydratase [Nocardioides luteus]GGR53363.1 2-keto-4-pentenoate hydratase [Nocardioides luteus]GLJ69884.1 2-keto-4-pentenoate hydratase [Nocardioides luteus]